MSTIEVKVPDIGDFKDVPVITVMVSPGDHVSEDDPLIELESDKAAMEVPSPVAGKVVEIKVAEGDIIRVDLRGDETPDSIEFDKVLFIGGDEVKIGQPLLGGAKVTADVLTEVRGEKITIIKFRRRKGYRRKRGHRQRFLRVKITDIAA